MVDLTVGSGLIRTYTGPQTAWHPNTPYGGSQYPVPPAISTDLAIGLGATAISRCAPTNPHASASQTLGELRRDGLPAIPVLAHLRKLGRPSKKEVPSVVGGEYLNVEFGWKPMLNDVKKLLHAQQDAEKVLEQYRKDSGRLVRRTYAFPERSETVVDRVIGNYAPSPALDSNFYLVRQGKISETVTTHWAARFSGAFTYHVAPADQFLGLTRAAQQANHLLGVGITPAVLWDLSPWTWAADWFANTGDVINNISMMQSDGLVVVYGYITVESTAVRTITNYGTILRDNNGTYPMDLTQTWTTKSQIRCKATPFGFSPLPWVFTPRQLAIVAALGLSSNGRKLSL